MSGLEIRPAQEVDRTAVRRVVEAAFGAEDPTHGSQVVDLVDALHVADRVALSLVAELDGAVVGHVQLNRSWVDAREALVDVLVLSPLSVEPTVQRGGIGTALVAAALDAARDAGSPAVFLEGSPDYYGARGFSRGSEHGFERPSVRIPEPAFQVALLPAHEPWMTGRLVYCDAFWELDCTGLRDPVLAELEQRFADR
jgi:putative acetyltransferase